MNHSSSIDQRVVLYQIIEQIPSKTLDKLNQFERKIVSTALESLKNLEREYVQQDLQGIIDKLQENPEREMPLIKKKRFTIKAWINEKLQLLKWKTNEIGIKILSRLSYAITMHQLLMKYEDLSSNISAFKRLPNLIQQKNESLAALQELSRFQTEDAFPLYQDIQEFYDRLPHSMDEAKPHLEQKIAEIKEQIKQAKIENKERAYIHILEKEILESLTKMRDFQRKNLKTHILEARDYVIQNQVKTFGNEDNLKILTKIQTQFDKELELTRKVWRKTANECKNQKYTQEAIAQTQEQIEYYHHQLRTFSEIFNEESTYH